MKRLFILMLALILLSSTAIAESAPAREFTVDEQAYDAYLDISYVHNQSIRYLSELGRLWDLANDLDDISDADELWFHAGLVANFGNSDSENGSRLLKFHLLATEKYGFNQVPDLYPAFKTFLSAYSGKTTDIIWAGLAMGIEAQYLISPDELKTYLDEAMQGIRSIMSKDREYPFLKELQNYYKEASYLLDYISDFEDNYIDCQEMLDTQKKNQSSYTIDFEFIFDPADFDYVMEVGATEAKAKEKEIYDRAVALENSGNYAEAIDLYWQCQYYSDSYDRIDKCLQKIETNKAAIEANKIEQKYQIACSALQEEKYWTAIKIFNEIESYKDSSSQILYCVAQLKNTPYVLATETYINSTEVYSYNDEGRLISSNVTYTDGSTLSKIYEYNNNGILEKSIQSSGTEKTILTFNDHGDILSAESINAGFTMMHEYTYGEYGEMLSHRYGRGPKFAHGYYYTYTYEYIFDIPIKKISYKDGEKAISETNYHYDEYGNLARKETLYYSSGNTEIATYTYKKIGQ